jgi:SAM-dependent methyltransferase
MRRGLGFAGSVTAVGSPDSTVHLAVAPITVPCQTFIEIGCSSGAVSISLASQVERGVLTDINPLAVENARQNITSLGISNLEVIRSDVFDSVTGRFDLVIFNPPYTNHPCNDERDMMFWDPNDSAKRRFFLDAHRFLRGYGRVLFGWADFSELDLELPLRLAAASGFALNCVHTRHVPSKKCRYFVLELDVISNAIAP